MIVSFCLRQTSFLKATGADYALPVKENHKNLKLDIELQFDVSAIDRRNS